MPKGVPGAPTRGTEVALLPNLSFQAGMSMRLYGSELLVSLKGIPGVRPTLLSPPFESQPGVGGLQRRWIQYVSYPAWAKRQQADLYHIVDHANAQLMLRVPGLRTVVTCHDLYPLAVALGHLRFPGAPSRSAMVPTSLRLTLLRKAAVVMTDSKYTLDECRRYLRVPASRLQVAYHGVSSAFRVAASAGAVSALRARLGVRPGDLVVLHVGSNDVRKNLSTAFHAVARIRERVRGPVVLLKVGSRFGPAELSVIRALDLQRSVLELGEVSEEELSGAYRVATVLLYPSFHEGFGRPVAEAMAAGLPVVASTGGSIPEITGGAAALYDPLDVQGMSARIVELLASPALRAEMAQAGQAASRRFTWSAHGRTVAGVYAALLSR